MPKPSARERILDSYEVILIERGPQEITLDAVAAHAGVSKGGLLYHFGSKDALRDGLLERLVRLNTEDLELARAAPEGVFRYYLRTAITDVTRNLPLHRTTMATIRLVLNDPTAAEVSQRCMNDTRELLLEHAEDRLSAELVMLVAEGLYMRAALGEEDRGLLDRIDDIAVRLEDH
ncbi:TetR/AcrR family transcriptional regulator [Amycolatopsis saalfeldensis]|uniref:DNA-binding transcriptional regulator, AcrR family n=1 Tax=Amycolatopsis saalfeldensis TaxID=394193 RepID=A0A1H8YIZ5_9PSEU|nr:TetR/AcrR family transcriptional regulator [Amycolatopsis saalfeldensis]SEP52184.1 DNA-binding transcriptional regulator, AcrR family [Amycolatopsis saalfeldensis]